MTLPHDAMIHEKREAECESGSAGAYFPGGVYDIRKRLMFQQNGREKYMNGVIGSRNHEPSD